MESTTTNMAIGEGTIDEAVIRNWFDNLYVEKGVESMRPFETYSIFLEYLEVQKGKKLLDVGCGPGLLIKAASKVGLDTCGIDLSEEAVNLAMKVSPHSKVNVGQGEKLEFEDHIFDYLTCIGTLEHFLDMRKGLEEMKRVTKKDALFCLMVPNSSSILWKVFRFFNIIDTDSNENAYPLSEWVDLFNSAGFKIERIFPDRWYLKKLLIPIFPNSHKKVEGFVRKITPKIFPLKYVNQFIFILRKN